MFHAIVQLLIILLVFVIYIEIKKWFITRKLKNFETPSLPPILGAATKLLGKSNDQIIDTVLKYFGEMKSTPFYVWAGPMLLVGVAEPDDIKTLLTNEHTIHKPYLYEHFHCKTSLIASKSEMWKRDRRALNSTFSVQNLRSFLAPLNQKANILVEKFESHLSGFGDLYRTIFIGMIDMVVRTTLGSEMNFQLARGAFCFRLIKQIMNSIMYRIARIWLRWDFVYFFLSKVGREERPALRDGNLIMDEIYDKKVNELKKLSESRSLESDYLIEVKERGAKNFLEQCLLLEQQGIFMHENVLDQMRVIVLAGSDTSSITIFATLLMLAMNPEYQERVIDELRSVFETDDCDVTQAHLNGMKYTERVIKETIRLIPPVPFIARQSTTEIELSKGETPKDTIYVINIMHLHRNPQIWGENVLEFDPDRFLPENVAKRPPFSYIPFSAGPRNCIGMKYAMMSAKISLAHILRRYKFSSDLRFQDIRLNTHLVTEIINENPIRVEKRNF